MRTPGQVDAEVGQIEGQALHALRIGCEPAAQIGENDSRSAVSAVQAGVAVVASIGELMMPRQRARRHLCGRCRLQDDSGRR